MPNKESNCACVVCQVERNLLDSLSTQIARTHFQALAANHPVLNHYDSPTDVIARLHEHERVETDNHNAWNGILHALVNGLADRTTEDIGQQLLLVAYIPAIHKAYREICQRFPSLCPEDIAQQAAMCFLEAAKSPEMHRMNGQLPLALVNRFRQSLFRWAMGEMRQALPDEEIPADLPEPQSTNFEDRVLLEHFLSKARRLGILSATECELVRKFHCEGFQPDELREGKDGPSGIALYYRVQRAVHRLRRIGTGETMKARRTSAPTDSTHSESKKVLGRRSNFSGSCAFRNSEKGFSPELSDVPQLEPDISQIPA
jgi:hypothetical protein